MASEEVRVYAVIHADFPAGSVSDAQWQSLNNGAKEQPLSSAIISAARAAQNYITARKRSQNASALRLYQMVGFEVNRADVDDLLVILDAQAVIHGVTGNNKDKFEGVLQAELQTVALSLGYTATQASKLTVSVIAAANRETAISQAQTYLANNAGIWYE